MPAASAQGVSQGLNGPIDPSISLSLSGSLLHMGLGIKNFEISFILTHPYPYPYHYPRPKEPSAHTHIYLS